MDVFATERVQEALKREFAYVFEENKYPGVPEVSLNTITSQRFRVKNIQLMPIDLMHYKMPVKGFRINDFAYLTDANYIAPEEKEKLQNLDVLILNALRKEEHISHFNLSEAIELVKELNPQKAYFTHISHLMGKHKEVESELPENIKLSYDGLVLELN